MAEGDDRSEVVFVIEPDAGGGFITHALGHTIVTEADDVDELQRNIADAMTCHFGGGHNRRPVCSTLNLTSDPLTPDS